APSEHLTFLLNDRGQAFTARAFSKWFVTQCRRGGVRGLSAPGLRQAACRRLGAGGGAANEIAASRGDARPPEGQRTYPPADQARMARNAIARTDQQHRLANPVAIIGKPGKKGR